MIYTFIEFQKKVKNLSTRTVTEYQKELRVFTDWLQARNCELRNVTKAQVDAFVMDEHDRGMKATTIKKRISVVRSFYAWAVHEGYVKDNPARFCQSPKGEKRLPRVAEVEAIDAYLRTPIRSSRSARVHLICSLLLETGLRLREAMGLKWSDINREQHMIVVTGKGRKERVAFYGKRTAEWLDRTQGMGDFVVPYASERRLREDLVNEVGGYVEGIHPHMLRHTYATALLNKGCALKDVSVLMGHAHVSTTEIYTRVATERLRSQYATYQF